MGELVDHELARLRRERDEAQAEAVRLRKALRSCESAMDVLNGDTGTKSRPCSFCRADVYDGQVGIVHRKDCPILGARAALVPAPGPAGERQGG